MEPLTGYRLIAPDLIGMGDSDKLSDSDENSYRFEDHAVFLDTFFDSCATTNGNDKFVLVLHDWGSALCFWWAYRHTERVQGIVYMESLVMPLKYEDFPVEFQEFFMLMRSPAGEKLILEDNIFIEETLPSAILRNLTQTEFDEYRRPFLESGEPRRPMLTWPREVPINGTPSNVVNIVQTYSDWLGVNNIPKLLVNAIPGLLLTGRPLEYARTFKNQTEVTVPGLHFIQEDSPKEIATAIDNWLTTSFLSLENGSTMSGANDYDAPPLLFLLMAIAFFRKFF